MYIPLQKSVYIQSVSSKFVKVYSICVCSKPRYIYKTYIYLQIITLSNKIYLLYSGTPVSELPGFRTYRFWSKVNDDSTYWTASMSGHALISENSKYFKTRTLETWIPLYNSYFLNFNSQNCCIFRKNALKSNSMTWLTLVDLSWSDLLQTPSSTWQLSTATQTSAGLDGAPSKRGPFLESPVLWTFAPMPTTIQTTWTMEQRW